MTVTGWNEAAIVYLLAIASPTHGIPATMWNSGWATNASYANGKSFYGYPLYVGKDYGGPMFFAHYSFLGFDPRDKADGYANYFNQNRNHSLIQQAYSEANPNGYLGYSANCWGLTASDDPDGYLAHEPNSSRDNGTITPTAALSSFPYTPDESMLALKHFYRELGAKTWGWMGFIDAFNQQRDWYASSTLAIDQGPIIIMIENHRSQLLWDLFMSNPEIQPMLNAIGFHDSPNSVIDIYTDFDLTVFPNPTSSDFRLTLRIDEVADVRLDIFSIFGTKAQNILSGETVIPGVYSYEIDGELMPPGIYMARLILNDSDATSVKIIIH